MAYEAKRHEAIFLNTYAVYLCIYLALITNILIKYYYYYYQILKYLQRFNKLILTNIIVKSK